jgi:putative protease
LERMQNAKGQTISIAPGSGHQVKIPLDANLEKAMLARFI